MPLTRYANSTDEVAKIQNGLTPWLLGGGPATGYAAPFNLAFKTQLKYYEWLEEPGHESRLHRFGHSMNGTRYWELAENIIHGASYRTAQHEVAIGLICGYLQVSLGTSCTRTP